MVLKAHIKKSEEIMTKKLLVIGLFLLGASGLSAQDLYIGQFNVRNDNAKDAAAGDGWATRCPVVCDIFGQGFCLEVPLIPSQGGVRVNHFILSLSRFLLYLPMN